MADNKDKTDFRDRSEINTNEDYEVRYWSEKFGVSAEELKEAVKSTGSNSAKKIEEYLSNNRR